MRDASCWVEVLIFMRIVLVYSPSWERPRVMGISLTLGSIDYSSTFLDDEIENLFEKPTRADATVVSAQTTDEREDRGTQVTARSAR